MEDAYNAIATSAVPGDADGDGDVDGQDFLLLQRDNPAGISEWSSNYGTGTPATSALAAVPEPSSACLLLMGAMIVARVRRSLLAR